MVKQFFLVKISLLLVTRSLVFLNLVFFGTNTLHAQTIAKSQISALIDQEYNSLEDLYKHLHAHPELSLHEKQTAELLTETLKKKRL